MLSYLMPEQRVPGDQPLRPILAMMNQAPDRIDGALEKMYADGGRPSIAPEKLLRALLLQRLYSAAQSAASRSGSGGMDVYDGRCGV